MKRLGAFATILALTLTGCVLTSGQFLVTYQLDSPLNLTTFGGTVGTDIDLNTNSTYKDHKGDLKDLADVALLGQFTNTGGSAITMEVWMTPDITAYTTDAQVTGGGVRVWGPLHLAQNQTLKIGWDESAKLFAGGKQALLDQIKGDGQFSMYAIVSSTSAPNAPGGTAPARASGVTINLRIDGGALVAVIEAGK